MGKSSQGGESPDALFLVMHHLQILCYDQRNDHHVDHRGRGEHPVRRLLAFAHLVPHQMYCNHATECRDVGTDLEQRQMSAIERGESGCNGIFTVEPVVMLGAI